MAHIQIAARISGTRDGADWPAVGEIISVPDDEAAEAPLPPSASSKT